MWVTLKNLWAQKLNYIKNLKENFKEFSLIRLENLSLLGTPDLLVYNNSGHFFTIELKVTKSKKVRFSPHQIAFHYKHPTNTFIIVEALGPRALNTYSMYKGSQIMELEACGLELEAYCLGLDACYLELAKLGA
jgi:hypothetical protein